MNPPHDTKLPDRFWSKVTPDENGCWLWTANRNHRGYGKFSVRGKSVAAHRSSATEVLGTPPGTALVLHHCDTRNCVRPSHIYYGTHADNMRDMVARGRAAVGEGNGRAKVTETQVAEIRNLKGSVTQTALASHYGVNRSTVQRIQNRTYWNHVE